MKGQILGVAERHWVCNHCQLVKITQGRPIDIPMHACRGFGGLATPFHEEGERVGVVHLIREDYLKTDDQARDADGRPVMMTVVDRGDRADVWVHAGIGRQRMDGHDG